MGKEDTEFFKEFEDGQPGGQQQQQENQQEQGNEQGNEQQQQETPIIELNQNGNEQKPEPAGQQQNGQQNGQQQPAFDFEAEVEKRLGFKPDVLKSKLDALPTLEAKANAKSYLSAYGEEFDKLVSPVEVGGKNLPAEVAIKYLSDTSKLGDREYKAMIMKIDNPTFTDSEIQTLIDLDYTLGSQAGVKEGDDEAVRSEKERIGSLKLKRDVVELRKKEAEYKAKMLEPYQSKGAIEVEDNKRKTLLAETTRKETWKGKQTELLNNFKTFKVPFGEKEVVKDGKKSIEPAGWYNFEVKPEVREKIAAEVAHYVESNPGLMPDEKGTQFVTQTLFTLAMYQHAMPNIAQALIDLGNSKERGNFSKELNNPSFMQGNSRTFDHSQSGGNEDFYDWMLKQPLKEAV